MQTDHRTAIGFQTIGDVTTAGWDLRSHRRARPHRRTIRGITSTFRTVMFMTALANRPAGRSLIQRGLPAFEETISGTVTESLPFTSLLYTMGTTALRDQPDVRRREPGANRIPGLIIFATSGGAHLDRLGQGGQRVRHRFLRPEPRPRSALPRTRRSSWPGTSPIPAATRRSTAPSITQEPSATITTNNLSLTATAAASAPRPSR